MTELDENEVWARDCIRNALSCCAVDQHDDGSQDSMHDLTITYPDGHTGAVEVTTAADDEQLSLWKTIKRHDMPWIEPTLTGGWIVRMLPSTRAKNLVRQLPGLLRSLEQAGLRGIHGDKASADQLSAFAGWASSRPCKGTSIRLDASS